MMMKWYLTFLYQSSVNNECTKHAAFFHAAQQHNIFLHNLCRFYVT